MNRRLTRCMTGLAVLASVLLCLMPTLGRFVHAAQAPAQAVGMAGMAGLPHAEHLALMARLAQAGHPMRMDAAPEPSDPSSRSVGHAGHGGGDCEYCPLLACLVAAASVPALAAGSPQVDGLPLAGRESVTMAAPVPSLGAQAPPMVG